LLAAPFFQSDHHFSKPQLDGIFAVYFDDGDLFPGWVFRVSRINRGIDRVEVVAEFNEPFGAVAWDVGIFTPYAEDEPLGEFLF